MFKTFCAETAQILTSKGEGKSFGAPGVLPTAEKPVKGTFATSIRDHKFICGHQRAWKKFRMLGNESNKGINQDLIGSNPLRNCYFFNLPL